MLAGQTKALGADHPETLVTGQNVAMSLRRCFLSRPGCWASIAQTFRTACSLAVSYRMMGLDKDVENILRATLTIQKKMLGGRHGDTVMTTLILDELLQDVGKL